MRVSSLDVLVRKFLLTKFFTKGWGSPRHLESLFSFRKVISNRETCYQLVPKNYPMKIRTIESNTNYKIIEGSFESPFAKHKPDLVPIPVRDAYFQMILPAKWPNKCFKPICIHLAGTGDHYFWRRRNIMALPLLKHGIGAIILENPYYGFRKPHDQLRSSLHYVSDLFVMGGCLILEGLVLLNWCEQSGFGPLGVTGISMGGHMASLVASNWPKPLVLVPCLSWSTASSVFTEGVMSESIDWDKLQEQYITNKSYCEQLSKNCKIVDVPFACNLSKNLVDSEFYYETSSENDLRTSYVTPYELVNFVKINGTEIDYKSNITSISSITKSDLLKTSVSFKRNKFRKPKAEEALWFMRGIMDECTHLKNFSVPVDTSLITAVSAKCDGYVPTEGVSRLDEIWPGTTVKYLDSGHIGAYIWYRKIFRGAIIETFDRAKRKNMAHE